MIPGPARDTTGTLILKYRSSFESVMGVSPDSYQRLWPWRGAPSWAGCLQTAGPAWWSRGSCRCCISRWGSSAWRSWSSECSSRCRCSAHPETETSKRRYQQTPSSDMKMVQRADGAHHFGCLSRRPLCVLQQSLELVVLGENDDPQHGAELWEDLRKKSSYESSMFQFHMFTLFQRVQMLPGRGRPGWRGTADSPPPPSARSWEPPPAPQCPRETSSGPGEPPGPSEEDGGWWMNKRRTDVEACVCVDLRYLLVGGVVRFELLVVGELDKDWLLSDNRHHCGVIAHHVLSCFFWVHLQEGLGRGGHRITATWKPSSHIKH